MHDAERITRIRDALVASQIDGLVCDMPANVRLLTGFWPVTGSTIAIVTREGASTILVPEDEAELAKHGWASDIRTFEPASLRDLHQIADVVPNILPDACDALGLSASSTLGIERSPAFDPATYASTLDWNGSIERYVGTRRCIDATELLEDLKATLTGAEIETLRRACSIASEAFRSLKIEVGMREYEVASALSSGLNRGTVDGMRAGGFAWCMSGPNAARAWAAYQRTSDRILRSGDLVLLHCNSYLDGMWTDITRTRALAPEMHPEIKSAIDEARNAALHAVAPGIEARSVDRAARNVMETRGFGPLFRHATGHGVGFAAIDHNAKPRIHPESRDLLRPGMTFNIEPAVYIEGVAGYRHCDMVAVTEKGAELLTVGI